METTELYIFCYEEKHPFNFLTNLLVDILVKTEFKIMHFHESFENLKINFINFLRDMGVTRPCGLDISVARIKAD